jgi:uncharacterized protein YdeI (YjbR/CyaY-like superfamily)
MEVTTTVRASTRQDWRAWLQANHETAAEIWLIYDDRPEGLSVSYLDSVEEAICFGWIDGIQKRLSFVERAQRFTPRRPNSNWTELNKQRARRLIQLGCMTDAGQRMLPDLSEPFVVADDILEAVQAIPQAWSVFQQLPELYIRVRVGYIEEMRKQRAEFERRLNHFVSKTAAGKQFGNWNDGGRLT